MIALVLEVYGALSIFSLIAFLACAAVAKLNSDLDEGIDEAGRLKKLASSERSGIALPVEVLIFEDPSRSTAARPVGRSKRPRLVHTHTPDAA